MGWVQPTISRVLGCTISGVDVTPYLRITSIHETICKPYLTGTLKIVDSVNIIDSLQLRGGEAVAIQFDAPPQSQPYNVVLYLHSIEGEKNSESFKSTDYTLNLIGPEFYKDAGNLVATSHQNQTATSAIQQIWGQYIGTALSMLSSSSGLIGSKSPYIAHNMKPFTAIEQLRKMAGSGSGNTLLYRNAKNAVFAALQDLLGGAGGSGGSFIQKSTWGIRFDDPQLYAGIIEAIALVDPKLRSGTFGTQDTAAAAFQGQQVFDLFKGVPIVNQMATQAMSGLANFGASAGSLGGSLNNQTTNSAVLPDSIWNNTIAAKALSASVKDRPQITVKVPLQTGIVVTVGNIVDYQLLPVTSDLSGISATVNPLSGSFLVAHLTHQLITSYNKVTGTTTMQSIKVS